MNSLFHDDIEPRDQTYRFIRDDPQGAEAKVFVERLWSFYCPYADANFKSAIASSFHARFWEMYLAFGLAAQGAELLPMPPKGPDLSVQGLTHSVWIEATVPLDGTGDNRVPKERLGTDQDIPSDSLILRYLNRIDEKFQKLRNYLISGIVKDSDPFIVAINSRSLSFSLYEPNPPRILQALFPLGDHVAMLHQTPNGWGVSVDFSYRDKIETKSGCPVSTNIFLNPTYDVISAVLFCTSDVWHRPPNDTEVGLADFMLIYNPMARNPIPRGWLTCGRECWVEDDQLVIKDWYKEHSSYTRETEPEMTLEDYIQKDNARRRVGEEWGCTVGGTDAMSQSLYDQDFYAWTKEQARAVHNKSWDKVDVEHLVEEIESLGSEQEHAVESHLANLLVHMLKWRYQPERRGKSWRQSILLARQRIARRLKRNPSLRPRLPFLLIDAYIDARALAASQTELPLDIFPDQCPWTLEQLQDPDFLPEE